MKDESIYCNLISANCLFCDLSPEALKTLKSIKNMNQFQKGAFIFSRGDVPSCVYILLEGQAQMIGKDSEPVCLVEPDEILGLSEMIAALPCRMNVETITPCMCERIEQEDFIAFLKNQPEVCFRLVQLLSSNIQKGYRKLSPSEI